MQHAFRYSTGAALLSLVTCHAQKMPALPRMRVDYLAAVPQNAKLWVTDRGLCAPHSSCRCSHFKAGGLLILTGRLLDFCLALQTTSVAARATTKTDGGFF